MARFREIVKFNFLDFEIVMGWKTFISVVFIRPMWII